MRQIILDTETTGLDPSQGHRIIEFAGLEMINRKLTRNHLHLYIYPERDIDPAAQNVHGISLESLEGRPVFRQVAKEIADFLRDAELIIHNAPFDVGFLNAEFARVGLPSVEELTQNQIIDTLKEAREHFPGKRNSLDALCDRFEINRSNRQLHGALIDCELLSEVYLAMTRGQESLLIDNDTLPSQQTLTETPLCANRIPLKIQYASTEEINAHTAYLNELKQTSLGHCIWEQINASKENAK